MQAEQIRVRVTIDGNQAVAVAAVEVRSTGYFAADRFEVAIALSELDLWWIDYLYTAGTSVATVELATALSNFSPLITGQIDCVRVDFPAGLLIVSGRDLAARLIDSEVSEAFLNSTASEIAQKLAARHGLTPNVTATSTPVGRYFERDYAMTVLSSNSADMTEWNLLASLAQLENFDLSVSGYALNFGPRQAVPATILAMSNLSEVDVEFIRALPAGITLRSWNCAQKAVIQGTYGGSGIGVSLKHPNLTQNQVDGRVAAFQADLAMQAMMLRAVMPGETGLRPGALVTLTGTNSALDRSYMVETIDRHVDGVAGFTQQIVAYSTQ